MALSPRWSGAAGTPGQLHQSGSIRSVGTGAPMASGQDLGLQLKIWLDQAGTEGLRALGGSTGLANRLVDVLGADDRLKGPLRDLCSQPLFLQALQSRGATQLSAVEALSAQLSGTYSPLVLQDLRALVSNATGVALAATELGEGVAPRDRTAHTQPEQHPSATPHQGGRPGDPAQVGQASQAAQATTAPAAAEGDSNADLPGWRQELRQLLLTLKAIAPALGLGAAVALVLAWLGGEVDRWLFEGWGWSGGVVLVLLLTLLQGLSRGPLRVARRHWPLNSRWACDRRRAWRWITAPWIHHRRGEALVNGVALLVILGASPLQLGDVLLRYALSSLTTLACAVLVAERQQLARVWDGASGAVGCLIGLGLVTSLWQRQAVHYSLGPLDVPAWVLGVFVLSLQLFWQLAPQQRREQSQSWERLLSSQVGWGLLLGLGWGSLNPLAQVGHDLLQALQHRPG